MKRIRMRPGMRSRRRRKCRKTRGKDNDKSSRL